MISEKRIIELAEQSGMRFEKYMTNPPKLTGYVKCNAEQLISLANALQAEWIQSLGEPKGYVYDKIQSNGTWLETIARNEPSNLSIDKGYVINVSKLYAIPNEEVK